MSNVSNASAIASSAVAPDVALRPINWDGYQDLAHHGALDGCRCQDFYGYGGSGPCKVGESVYGLEGSYRFVNTVVIIAQIAQLIMITYGLWKVLFVLARLGGCGKALKMFKSSSHVQTLYFSLPYFVAQIGQAFGRLFCAMALDDEMWYESNLLELAVSLSIMFAVAKSSEKMKARGAASEKKLARVKQAIRALALLGILGQAGFMINNQNGLAGALGMVYLCVCIMTYYIGAKKLGALMVGLTKHIAGGGASSSASSSKTAGLQKAVNSMLTCARRVTMFATLCFAGLGLFSISSRDKPTPERVVGFEAAQVLLTLQVLSVVIYTEFQLEKAVNKLKKSNTKISPEEIETAVSMGGLDDDESGSVNDSVNSQSRGVDSTVNSSSVGGSSRGSSSAVGSSSPVHFMHMRALSSFPCV